MRIPAQIDYAQITASEASSRPRWRKVRTPPAKTRGGCRRGSMLHRGAAVRSAIDRSADLAWVAWAAPVPRRALARGQPRRYFHGEGRATLPPAPAELWQRKQLLVGSDLATAKLDRNVACSRRVAPLSCCSKQNISSGGWRGDFSTQLILTRLWTHATLPLRNGSPPRTTTHAESRSCHCAIAQKLKYFTFYLLFLYKLSSSINNSVNIKKVGTRPSLLQFPVLSRIT